LRKVKFTALVWARRVGRLAGSTGGDQAASLSRARITVIADHGFPVGAATSRSFRMRGISRTDGLAGGFQRCIELWPLPIVILTRLHLGKRLGDLEAFLIGKASDQCLLRLQAET
jgi:hypothetical protein